MKLPAAELEQARACAAARGVSLPAIVRAGLRRFVAAEATTLTATRGRPFVR